MNPHPGRLATDQAATYVAATVLAAFRPLAG